MCFFRQRRSAWPRCSPAPTDVPSCHLYLSRYPQPPQVLTQTHPHAAGGPAGRRRPSYLGGGGGAGRERPSEGAEGAGREFTARKARLLPPSPRRRVSEWPRVPR